MHNIIGKMKIVSFLTSVWAKILGLDQKLIQLDDKFGKLGGGSAHADLIYQAIILQFPSLQGLRPTIAYDYPTIQEMAEHIQNLFNQESKTLPLAHCAIHVEPIAIIGMSCRFPGQSNDPEQYWSLLEQGRDAIIEVPKSRFNIDDFYDTDRKKLGKTVSRWGGFIDDIELFDAAFFGISPVEAACLDPQQRILLELTWHALESAAIDPKSLKNSLTGVFTGAMFHDYENLLLKTRAEGKQQVHYSIGNAFSAMAGRISYTLGLQGPCMAVDTACSSSLVAVHQACQNLRIGECNLAIVGGVNALLSPEIFIVYSGAKMLSRDGKCKTFSDDANGYVRSEGAGVVILKRLGDAIRDHDPILAVIPGSAINQDGASSGITAPNGVAQERLLRQALKNSGLKASDIDYFEAHGTGTRLGDPIEVGAIGAVYAENRSPMQPLIIGTAKTNIGHCESAAGIAGLIKVVLSLQHETIPAILNFTRLNPRLDLDCIPAKLALSPLPWKKRKDHVRRAAINSFGFSGINANLIVEEAPIQQTKHNPLPLTIFNRQRYWIDVKSKKFAKEQRSSFAFLSSFETLSNGQWVFDIDLSQNVLTYLNNHLIFDEPIFPAAGYIELLFEVMEQMELKDAVIHNLEIMRPIRLVQQSQNSLQLIFQPESTGRSSVILRQAWNGESGAKQWTTCLQAKIEHAAQVTSRHYDLDTFATNHTNVATDAIYAMLAYRGLSYQNDFKSIQSLQQSPDVVWIKLVPIEVNDYIAHPATMDGALQAAFFLLEDNVCYLPSAITRIIRNTTSGVITSAVVRLQSKSTHTFAVDIDYLDALGRVVISLESCQFRRIDRIHFATVEQAASTIGQPKAALMELLLAAKPEERHGLLIVELKRVLCEVLNFPLEREISLTQGFFDLGMDSLLSGVFLDRLQELLGETVSLSNTIVFDQGNLTYLIEHLETDILKDIFTQAPIQIKKEFLSVESKEPIAVIGMACRFPGGANSIEEFWRLLQKGFDGISEVPKDRWDIDEFYDPDPDAPGKINTRRGGFLNIDVSLFDASFFRISPKEAECMDPQQRLLLEVTWEALESAGIPPHTLNGQKVGVYIGIATHEYAQLIAQYQDKNEITSFNATGNFASVASGRIAYFLGCEGPTLTVDTACSSSLTAIHLACQALRAGETELAIVGGVNLLLAPDNMIDFSKAHMLSNDGYCKTFDSNADGYVRGEGCGVVLLKRLSEAKRDNDNLLALIKGSAINQDGASSGLTVPNGRSQVNVIRAALAQAQLEPNQIDYIETHGTGTRLGDPVEVRALSEVFGGRDREDPLKIGSVKTNMGHLEGAAGIAGLIKTILSLNHNSIPAHLHLNKLNPMIDLSFIPAQIPTTEQRWENTGRIRRAGVSSFGFSGTNVHVIVEESPLIENKITREKLPAVQFNRQKYWIDTSRRSMVQTSQITNSQCTQQTESGRLVKMLRQVTKSERKQLLTSELEHILKEVLGSSQTILDRQRFFDLGMNSLMMVKAAGRIKSALGSPYVISDTLLFEQSSLQALTEYLSTQILHEVFEQSKKEKSLALFTTLKSEEPIAIVGMACRFPGGANSIEEFWQLLEQGRDGIADVPSDRWNMAEFYDPDPDAPGKINTRKGGFLDTDISLFDAGFFNISPKEAELMDPQQRLLLEVTCEALVHAGIKTDDLNSAHAGVYIGISTNDYMTLQTQYQRKEDITAYVGTGNHPSVAAGRISYFLGVHGPAISIDTACSSSLVAVHLACQGLKFGEVNCAIVGGVNLILAPDMSINISKAHMLSGDGYCKTFDANADGYVRGEGCGVIILKRLSDATRDGDSILAVIKGSAINQDGASSGLTVPNGSAQEAVISQALHQAQLKPADIDYVEAHGTGTRLGDPIEVKAIGQVLGDREEPLFISSVKPNIGHLEAVAGIAGLIKTVLALQHELIPAHQHLKTLNPMIELSHIPAEIPSCNIPWIKNEKSRHAGISSFGSSGTNAHIIIGEAPIIETKVVRKEVPPIVFNRKRYWLNALDERLVTSLLDDNCYYTQAWVNSPILKNKFSAHEIYFADSNALHPENTPNNCCIVFKNQPDFQIIFQFVQQLIRLNKLIKNLLFLVNQEDLNSSLYLGLVKALRWEYPQLNARCILAESHTILESIDIETEIQQLLDPIVLYRATGRYTPIVQRAQLKEDVRVQFNPEGAYWITGGFGGLGLKVANWLAEKGVKHLVLTSRTGRSEKSAAILNDLEQKGVRLYCHALDVTDENALKIFLKNWDKTHPPLIGLYHLAGVNLQKSFVDTTWLEMTSVLASKVQAAWQLHELTQQFNLEQFVLFSSVSSFFGSNRQSAYVIANSYLDALGEYRHKQGLPVTVINWALFSEVGMATETALTSTGLISPSAGMRALTKILGNQCNQVAVIKPDFMHFMFDFYPQPFPCWFGDILKIIDKSQSKTTSLIIQDLLKLESDARIKQLMQIVMQVATEVLGVTDDRDIYTGFFDLGMDSLMAVDLRNKLQARTGLDIKATLAFDYPTIEKITYYLNELITEKSGQIILMPHQHHQEEPIAIIGMSCRFPGHANHPQEFWQNLREGKDGISEVPASRWDIRQYYDPNDPNKSYAKEGGFVDDLDLFDAEFFGISPKEAIAMDPQQRLLLELAWHALESAGIPPNTIKETDTGIFVGISQSEYNLLLTQADKGYGAYGVTGNALNVAAGRLAYVLGTQGKTLAIDTACSSSLVAIHEACLSLRAGESETAIVGGVNAIIAPEIFISLSQARMLSPTGRCHTFDESADGYVRGEGAGVVILKRLSDAKKAGNPILAIIRGTAVNQDGASSGLTVPNGVAQSALINRALVQSGLIPDDIDYIEAHGTGTSLGDPIEISALSDVYQGRHVTRPLIIGSAKASIGHLESAAGIAGIIKTVLSLNHEWIPKQLNLESLNSHIQLDPIPAIIPTQGLPWIQTVEHIRRAGVSSFGFSGTNAHVIIEEAPKDYMPTLNSLSATVFNRQRYWPVLKPNRSMDVAATSHPFLQRKIDLVEDNWYFFESMINAHYPEFIPDHLIYGYPVIAGAGYISAALSLARDYFAKRYCHLKNIEFIEALVLSDDAQATQILVKAKTEGSQTDIQIFSLAPGQSNAQLRARLHLDEDKVPMSLLNFSAIQQRFNRPAVYTGERHLAIANQLSLNLGIHFHWLESVQVNGHETLAKMRVPLGEIETARYVLYPGYIDSTFQSMLATLNADEEMLSIPFKIDNFIFDVQAGVPHWVYGVADASDPSGLRRDFYYFDENGVLLGQIMGFTAQRAPKAALERSLKRQLQALNLYYERNWCAVKSDAIKIIVGDWLYRGELPGLEQLQSTFPAHFVQDKPYTDPSLSGILLYFQDVKNPLDPVLILLDIIKSGTRLPIIVITEAAQWMPQSSSPLNAYPMRQPNLGSLSGFIKTALLENPDLDLVWIDYLSRAISWTIPANEPILVYRDEVFYAERLMSHPQWIRSQQELRIPTVPWYLNQSTKGSFDNLSLESAVREPVYDDEVELAIAAVGLNFKDVLNALGLYPGEAGNLGGDCAGVITKVGKLTTGLMPGDRVHGIALGTFRSYAKTNPKLLAKLPDHLSYVEGASLPAIMLTAHYGLNHLAKIKSGDKVLIHTAAGGVGLMAVQLAQNVGAEIYATASKSKHHVLQRMGVAHVYDSRSTSFAAQILQDTDNQGVDVVLNTLTSEGFKEATLQCLRLGGTLVEISKRNIYTSEEMRQLRSDVEYHIMALYTMFTEAPDTIQQLMQELGKMIEAGKIKPPPIITYPIEEVSHAFRYMQSAKHVGKIVITQPLPLTEKVKADASYLITGGLGGLGLITAKTLAAAGARNIVLTGRRAPNAAQSASIKRLEQTYPGICIQTQSVDVTDTAQISALLATLGKNLKGIFHLAGVLDDGILLEQTTQRFEKVFNPKANAACVLHELTQDLNLDLDYFILFSSIASSMGSPGQSNYAAANSFLDQLALYRHQRGLVATSINWGPWLSAGMAANLSAEHASKGFYAFSETDGMAALQYCLQQSQPVIQAADIRWQQFAKRNILPAWLGELVKKTEDAQQGYLIALLEKVEENQREEILKAELTKFIKAALGLGNAQALSDEKGFFEMGMDSLMAIDLRNKIQTALGRDYVVSNTLLFDKGTLSAVCKFLMVDVLSKYFSAEYLSSKKLTREEWKKLAQQRLQINE